MNKKVLMVRALKGYPDSRLEKEVYSLSKKYDVTVLAWDRGKTYSNPRESERDVFGKKIKYIHIGEAAPIGQGFSKLFFPELKYWRKLYHYLKENARYYGVVHACDFDTGFITSKAINRSRNLFVYDIYDYYADAKSGPAIVLGLIRNLEDKVISTADLTIICSERRKEQICHAKYKNLAIIHNTPLDSKIIFDDSKEVHSGKPKLVYVGSLSRDRYLEEIADVIMDRDDIEWHVGGWGPLEDLFEKLSNESDKIKYYGELSYENALLLEQQCDIMTALYDPSIKNHKYAAPNKFYESLMIGKPLIMMENTGMDEYVKEYGLGEVIKYPVFDWKEAFSKALDRIIHKKDNWKDMMKKGKELYKREFSWNRMESELLNSYEKIMSNK